MTILKKIIDQLVEEKSPERERCSFFLDKRLVSKLKEIAKQYKIPVSRLLEKLISESFKN